VPAAEVPAASPEDQLKTDVLSALQNLGYHRPLAEKALEAAVAGAASETLPASFERVFKGALKALMRP
jgi:Holliday junction resolvasome RuvABC DNA-binding subunit